LKIKSKKNGQSNVPNEVLHDRVGALLLGLVRQVEPHRSLWLPMLPQVDLRARSVGADPAVDIRAVSSVGVFHRLRRPRVVLMPINAM